MSKLDVTILSLNQILWHYDTSLRNKRLSIFEKRGARAKISEYAILLGGNFKECKYNDLKEKDIKVKSENRTGQYWTKTSPFHAKEFKTTEYVKYIRDDQFAPSGYVLKGDIGVRPAISYSSIVNNCTNKARAEDGILEIEFGEYPQMAASLKLQKILEKLYKIENLKKTGKSYYKYEEKTCFPSPITVGPLEEYKFQGKKYVRVRVKGNSYLGRTEFALSNGEKYHDGDYVWIKVEPIKWLVDEEKDIAVAEKILFLGIPLQDTRKNNVEILDNTDNIDFINTPLKAYLDRFFSNEILPLSITNTQDNSKVESTICNYHLQQETRNPIIIDSNLIYENKSHSKVIIPTKELEEEREKERIYWEKIENQKQSMEFRRMEERAIEKWRNKCLGLGRRL